MEQDYVNVDKSDSRASQNQKDPRSSERRFHRSVVLSLGLLNVLLLAGLGGLHVHYHVSVHRSAADFSIIKANLTERLQISNNKLSSLSEERDLLNASLIAKTKELDRLQTLSKPRWSVFMCSCYLLSTESGSWTRSREDCRNRGADLVVIDSAEEQTFLSNFTEVETWTWIGLTDEDMEGIWKWTDGTPLTLRYWEADQPDNGGGNPQYGEEDCAHMRTGKKTEQNWNDLSCSTSTYWICER